MKRITITLCAATLLVACNSETKTADNEKKDEAKVASATDKKADPLPDSVMMQNWVAYMTPGKEHQWMKESSGTWSTEVTSWMKPDAPPAKSTGTTTTKMILGDRYQESIHSGSWDKTPFEGRSTLAFDNAKKKFISTWIDNMGTGIMIGEGTWDEASQSITIKGKFIDPSRNDGSECDFREVYKIVDKDHHVMEMYGPDPATGKEYKSMEIKYTRKK